MMAAVLLLRLVVRPLRSKRRRRGNVSYSGVNLFEQTEQQPIVAFMLLSHGQRGVLLGFAHGRGPWSG